MAAAVKRRQSYPLGALFVLVTTCAVLAVGIAPLAGDSSFHDGRELLVALGLGALGGLFVGILAGLLQFRLALGLSIGAVAGMAIGLVAGALAILPAHSLNGAAAAMTGGSVLIVVVALVMRRTTR